MPRQKISEFPSHQATETPSNRATWVTMKCDEIEDLRIYQQAEDISDQIWSLVLPWKPLARDTVGKQLIKAVDSIGANIAEGHGRYHIKENVRFLHIARGSLVETKFWMKRAHARDLLSDESISRAAPQDSEPLSPIECFYQQQKGTRFRPCCNENSHE